MVQEELRQRVLASPYGRLMNALPGAAFDVHPYKRPVIGSIDDLNAATLDDVRRFHATYYRPDNAVLIVAGDFDGPRFDAWVDSYFGRLAAPATPIPRVDAAEPRRRDDRRLTVHGPNVPLPALALVWQAPAARDADAPALDVASALLSAGDSSRLNQALVYRQRIAQAAGFGSQLNADAGYLMAYAIAASGQPLARLEAALLAEIERLATRPIAPAEMDKVQHPPAHRCDRRPPDAAGQGRRRRPRADQPRRRAPGRPRARRTAGRQRGRRAARAETPRARRQTRDARLHAEMKPPSSHSLATPGGAVSRRTGGAGSVGESLVKPLTLTGCAPRGAWRSN